MEVQMSTSELKIRGRRQDPWWAKRTLLMFKQCRERMTQSLRSHRSRSCRYSSHVPEVCRGWTVSVDLIGQDTAFFEWCFHHCSCCDETDKEKNQSSLSYINPCCVCAFLHPLQSCLVSTSNFRALTLLWMTKTVPAQVLDVLHLFDVAYDEVTSQPPLLIKSWLGDPLS